jgi:hypothetical protein
MLGQKRKLAKQAFNREIVTTFGKLDTRDIDKIDGRPEQLLPLLVDYYGWSTEDAQAKVDRFMVGIATRKP